MGGRYILSGVQLEMLSSALNSLERKRLIDSIIECQFIWNSDKTLDEDIASIMLPFKKERV